MCYPGLAGGTLRAGQHPDSEQFRSAPRTFRPLCGRLSVRPEVPPEQVELTAVYMSQAPSPIRAYYRKLVKQLVYGALTD
jgi:hypothetical protein